MYWCVLDNNLGVFCCYSCHLVMSDSLQPHELLDARLSCLSPSSEICPSSCLLHPAISSSDALFSFCPQSFPASGTSPMSRLLASDDQNTGASASASVLPMNIQGWFCLGLTGLISLQSNGLSRGFSNTTIQKHQFFGTQPSLRSSSHIHTGLLEKPQWCLCFLICCRGWSQLYIQGESFF